MLKTRYDVESLAQKQNEMEQLLITNQGLIKDPSELLEQVDDFESYLPVTNEDELREIEQKLETCKLFKSNAVSQSC